MVTTSVRLQSLLGEGGMGSVWLADHLGLGTPVAVKFISPHLLARLPSALARFEREASAAARIKSPHVVHMLDHGVMDDGMPFLVMEYLEGESLGDYLTRNVYMSATNIVNVLEQAAKGIDHAHSLCIIHRDIKPDNIFLQAIPGDVVVKILDFGIAKENSLADNSQLTNTGSMLGTPNYMSPEHIVDAKHVDGQADLWSLAVVTYEALTGVRPFSADSLGGTIVAVTKIKYHPPSTFGTAKEFDEWCARAFNASPAKRFSSAKEMAVDLRRILLRESPTPNARLLDVNGSRPSVAGNGSAPPAAVGTPASEPTVQTPVSQTDLLALPIESPATPTTVVAPVDQAPKFSTDAETFAASSATIVGTGVLNKRNPVPIVAVALVSLALLVMGIVVSQLLDAPGDDVASNDATASKHEGTMLPPHGMIRVDGGRYTIGCRPTASDCFDDEKPAHPFSVASFAIMKHEVTVAEYASCVSASACTPPGTGKRCTGHKAGHERYPINCVDWHDAQSYCKHKGWRLPTEQQWEVAALGHEGADYPWGPESPSCGIAVIADDTAPGCGTDQPLPIEARGRDVSWAGVHDLGGSMREWTRSDYAPYPGGSLDEGRAGKVNRGGSWIMKKTQTSTSHTRAVDRPGERRDDLGFRCVLEPEG